MDRQKQSAPNGGASTSAVTSFQEEPGHSLWQPASHRPCYQEVLASAAREASRETCLLFPKWPFSSRPLTGGLGSAHRPAPFPRGHQHPRYQGLYQNALRGEPCPGRGSRPEASWDKTGSRQGHCAWTRPRAHTASRELPTSRHGPPCSHGRAGSLARGVREGPGPRFPSVGGGVLGLPHPPRAPFLRPCPVFAGAHGAPTIPHARGRPQHRHHHPKFKRTVLAKIKHGGKNPGKVLRRERSSGRGGLGATGITGRVAFHTTPARLRPSGLAGRRPGGPRGTRAEGGAQGASPVEARLVHGRSARHTGPVRSAGV